MSDIIQAPVGFCGTLLSPGQWFLYLVSSFHISACPSYLTLTQRLLSDAP